MASHLPCLVGKLRCNNSNTTPTKQACTDGRQNAIHNDCSYTMNESTTILILKEHTSTLLSKPGKPCQQPRGRGKDENHETVSKDLARRRGHLPRTFLLRALVYRMRSSPVFFCTNRIGVPYGDTLGRIQPRSGSYSICYFT